MDISALIGVLNEFCAFKSDNVCERVIRVDGSNRALGAWLMISGYWNWQHFEVFHLEFTQDKYLQGKQTPNMDGCNA